jgi:hypothetical protein
MRKLPLLFSFALLAQPSMNALSAEPSGPPQFVTIPIITHVAEEGLDHGHFVFGEEAALPAPLAPDRGAATYSPAPAGAPISGISADLNTSNAANSYEGESGATSNGTILVSGSNHIYPGKCSASASSGNFGDCAPAAYASTDGTTWTMTTLPRTWNGTTFGYGFDPSLDVDKNGNFYFAYGVAPLSGSYPNAIVVATSKDGVNWQPTKPVTFNKNKAFDDKYYMAVDRSNSAFANRLYVAWDRNQGFNQILYVAYSSNGGSTWNAPVKVNDGKSSFERVIDAYPAVDEATGVVYVSWHDYAKGKIFVDKSTNGGVSWGSDVAAATTHTGFGMDIGCVGGRAQGPAHHLKVGPSGTLYLVYADNVTGRGFDILLTNSTDGGAHWSTPVTLNDDGLATGFSGAAHQFHPTLSVESNGAGGDKVTITFYDRRDDPNNCLSHVYATQSTNNGATWSANVRLTSAQSDFDGNPNGPGDYSSSTPHFLSGVWPFYSDHRTTNAETASGGAFDIYTAEVQ